MLHHVITHVEPLFYGITSNAIYDLLKFIFSKIKG